MPPLFADDYIRHTECRTPASQTPNWSERSKPSKTPSPSSKTGHRIPCRVAGGTLSTSKTCPGNQIATSLSFGLYGSFHLPRFLCCVAYVPWRHHIRSVAGAMLVNHRSKVFVLYARIAALRVPGPSCGWFLAAMASKYVSRLLLRRSSWFRSPRGMHCCFAAACWRLLGARQVDWDVQCWLRTPPIKEVNAWQRCDFLEGPVCGRTSYESTPVCAKPLYWRRRDEMDGLC